MKWTTHFFLTDHGNSVLQPDIMAPGIGILAAIVPQSTEPGSVPIGKKTSLYSIRSGTSMACPHVTGTAALIKSVHKNWSPSMIKSALMTTGSITKLVLYFFEEKSYFDP